MLTVLLQALAVAALGFASPGSMTLVILLLMSDRGWRNGLSFVFGYLVMYSLIGAGVLVLGVNAAENNATEPGITRSVLLLSLGLILLTVGVRTWRHQPGPTADSEIPSRFSRLVDGITPLKSFVLAATIAVVNVKNLTIYLTAVSVVLLSSLLLSTKLAMLIPLVFIFCTSVITPVVIYLAFPNRSDIYLTRIKNTIDRNSRPLGIAVSLILGSALVYRGLLGLL